MESTYYNYLATQNEVERKRVLRESFFRDNQPFYGFKTITKERKKEIEENVMLWCSMQSEAFPLELFYKILIEIKEKRRFRNSKKFLLTRGDESFLFFILAFDPNLDILKISFESSNEEEIRCRFKEQFGFPYDDRLRQIEFY